MADLLKPGNLTSEFAMAKEAGWAGYAIMALGFIAQLLEPYVGGHVTWLSITAIIVGAIYGAATKIWGYMKPRAQVKAAHEHRLALEKAGSSAPPT